MPVLPVLNAGNAVFNAGIAGIAVFNAGIAVFNAGIAVFRTPMKTIVHVNQHIIRKNLKNKENNPVLTVKTHKSNTYAHTVEIQGPSRVVYSPNKPLSCGARVWIETHAEVVTDTHQKKEN